MSAAKPDYMDPNYGNQYVSKMKKEPLHLLSSGYCRQFSPIALAMELIVIVLTYCHESMTVCFTVNDEEESDEGDPECWMQEGLLRFKQKEFELVEDWYQCTAVPWEEVMTMGIYSDISKQRGIPFTHRHAHLSLHNISLCLFSYIIFLYYTGYIYIDPFAVKQASGSFDIGFIAWYHLDGQYIHDDTWSIHIMDVMIDHANGKKKKYTITKQFYSPTVDHIKYAENMTRDQINSAILRFSKDVPLRVKLDQGDKIYFTFSRYLECEMSTDGFEITAK